MRTIKKYPNRRLYDTELSKYITLSHIRDLVIEREPFVVIDKKSGEDITRTILMQVIIEQEQHGEPVMTEDFLSQIIRTYSSAMPNVVSNYLEQSLRLFSNQQAQARSALKKVVGIDPVDAVAGLAQRNFARWRAVQEEVFRVLSGSKPNNDGDRNNELAETADATDSGNGEASEATSVTRKR